MELEPDYLFADSLLAALIEAGTFGVPGISFDRERHRYRVDVWRDGRNHFHGYFPATGKGLVEALRVSQEARDAAA